MLYYDYKFKKQKNQILWQDILNNTFEYMELYYRKQLSMTMTRILSYFKKAFKITPRTLKDSADDKIYNYKLLAIYLLTKYSNEDFKTIAQEFHTTFEIVEEIYSNDIYQITFQNEIKLFFKQFEEDYLLHIKSSMAFKEDIADKLMSNMI